MEKVKGPLMALPFLGLILNSVKQEIRMLPEKLVELMQELDRRSTRRKATKHELHSLIGKLPFAAGGRLLPRHLIILASTVAHLHYWIRLNAKASANITWWWTLIPANMERHCQVYRLELSAG